MLFFANHTAPVFCFSCTHLPTILACCAILVDISALLTNFTQPCTEKTHCTQRVAHCGNALGDDTQRCNNDCVRLANNSGDVALVNDQWLVVVGDTLLGHCRSFALLARAPEVTRTVVFRMVVKSASQLYEVVGVSHSTRTSYTALVQRDTAQMLISPGS